jgi:hypothetical protein
MVSPTSIGSRAMRLRHAWRALSAALSAALILALVVAPTVAHAQANAPVIGRWDLTVEGPDYRYPSWLEVSLSGRRTLVGRFVGGGGSARPIAHVTMRGDSVHFAIPPQWDLESNDLQFDAVLVNNALRGTIVTPRGERHRVTGVRAPLLRRSVAPVWGDSIVLFGGTDMAAWTPLSGTSRWEVINGILTNTRGGANLATRERFTDFRLHVEFRYPKGGNSGIYLRGRHEVQIEDSGDLEPESIHLGGIYGFLTPNQVAAKGPGVWQTLDITLVGRRVTVVLNGTPIIVDQTIPGITGGALDSREGEPGPIYLQGDHTAVEFRRIVIQPSKNP